MKDTMIEKAFDSINPTQAQKDRMRAAIAARLPEEKPVKKPVYRQKQAPTRRWSWLPAAAALFVVVALGGFIISSLRGGNAVLSPAPGTEPTETTEMRDSFTESSATDYDSLLQTYETAAKEGWSASRCLQEGISELCASGELGYCLMDLDGNGVEELIISDGKCIYDLYTINPTVTRILSAGVYDHYTLMDGFSIRSVSDGDLGGTYYVFYRLTDGFALIPEKTVIFNGTWSAGQTDVDAKPITDSEAGELLNANAELSIDITPFA